MKKTAVLFLLLSTLHARADLVIKQIMEMSPQGNFKGMTLSVTIKIKGERTRTDNGEQASSITDMSTGDGVRLDHTKRQYVKISAAQTRDLVMGRAGAPPAEPPKITDTGKAEKVNGHDTEIYSAEVHPATGAGKKFTYWIAKDLPDFAAIQTQLKKISALKAKSLGAANNFIPDPLQLDGIPVRTEVLSLPGADGSESTTNPPMYLNLISAKVEEVSDAEFEVPADYTEAPTPAAKGAAAPQAGSGGK